MDERNDYNSIPEKEEFYLPGRYGTPPFDIMFVLPYIKERDIMEYGEMTYSLQVLSLPRRKWYKRLLQMLTFGLYKAPWQYFVKIIENG